MYLKMFSSMIPNSNNVALFLNIWRNCFEISYKSGAVLPFTDVYNTDPSINVVVILKSCSHSARNISASSFKVKIFVCLLVI